MELPGAAASLYAALLSKCAVPQRRRHSEILQAHVLIAPTAAVVSVIGGHNPPELEIGAPVGRTRRPVIFPAHPRNVREN
jgi:hypothetical protein